MSETVEILRDARALVAKGWCQGAYRRTIDGVECFCAVGAMDKASDGRELAFRRASEVLESVIVPDFITTWNDADGQTQDEVVAGFDRAIEMEEAK